MKLTDYDRRRVAEAIRELRANIYVLVNNGLLRLEKNQYVATIKAKIRNKAALENRG